MRVSLNSTTPFPTSLQTESDKTISPLDVCNIHISVDGNGHNKYPGQLVLRAAVYIQHYTPLY